LERLGSTLVTCPLV
jgi:hypothetical protein